MVVDILFPIFTDLKDIEEATECQVRKNNWRLMYDEEEYNKVMQQINENRKSDENSHGRDRG